MGGGDIMVLAFSAVRCRPLEWEPDREASIGRPRLVPGHCVREVGVLMLEPSWSVGTLSIIPHTHTFVLVEL